MIRITYVVPSYSTNGGATWTAITNSAYNTGSYSWTLPYNVASQYCRIQIKNYYNSATVDVSDNFFTIVAAPPSVTVSSPNGGNSFTAGSSQNITWSYRSVSNVRLEYTTNNGSSWATIVSSTAASAGSYAWTVPSVSSTFCKVRVSDASNSSVYDMSDNIFTIAIPTLTVTTPNGGEVWTAGTYQSIYWASSGGTSYVKLEYSTNNGTTWTSISSKYYNYGNYGWYVPNVPSTTCQVRITDYYASTVTDVSDANFTIKATTPTVAVTTPNGGQSWGAGSSQYIYWSATNISNVKIELTKDNGATWSTIVSSTSGTTGYYNWTIPSNTTASTLCKIRVSDVTNSSIYDVSNNVFSITVPYITVTTPNGGESWTGGTSNTIYWSSSGTGSYVKLDYSTDNGTTWTSISSMYYNYGYYNWTVPNVPSSNCKVRVTDYSTSTITDMSNSVFTIVGAIPTITVTTPNGGEKWLVNSSQYIYWSSTNSTNVKLEYSTNNGSTWSTIVASTPASNNYYYWSSVPNTPSTSCLIKVSDVSSPSYYDVSNAVFSIVSPYITVTAANGGESWPANSYQTIAWNSAGVNNVTLEYSTNGGSTWNTIVAGTYNYGTYSWYVTNSPSSTCKVRVTDYYSATVTDMSDANFTISPAGSASVTVTSPNTNVNWVVGSAQYIQWTKTGITNVKIEYSINNGSTWTTIISSTSASSSYYWSSVPNTPSTQCKIRISDASNSSISDQNNGTFNIVTPSITVTTPNGGETWTANAYKYIYWTSTNASSYVKIDYSTNSGLTWTSISTYYYNSGSYNWYVSNNPSSNCKIRVTDYYTSTITDMSNAVFTIAAPAPVVTLSTPNGGENWAVGSSKAIQWSSSNITNVKLEYTTDNGSTWSTIISSTAASTGSYYWTVPNAPSTTCKVRISDASNAAVSDMSNSIFSIVTPSFTITTPNGGESYTAGTSQTIYWTSTSTSSYVKLDYSTNNGLTWTSISSQYYNYGYYSLTVPNVPSTSCKIRITDYSNSTITDMSDANFTITAPVPTVTVSTPNGGQSLAAGSSQYIYWSSSNVTNVKLEYTTNNGGTWSTIIASTAASAGSYYWTVPSVTSSLCKIRITDASNASVYDMSDNVFTINVPSITIVTPNGGESWAGGSSQYIYWSFVGTGSYVKIEYSTNNGTTWTTISSMYYNYGYYNWTVPNNPSTTCLVRVTDYYTTSIKDVSNATFTITPAIPTLAVNTPNGGQNWAVGSSQYISWSTTYVTNVKLEYSSDNGSTWNTIISSTAANAGGYYWTIPNAPSCSTLVKISDASNASYSDVSNTTFCIVTPNITVTSPNGGETFTPANYKYIYWTSAGASNNVNLDYSTNNGTTWTRIATAASNNGSYYWYVPSVSSLNCLVKVTDYYTSTLNDVSNNVFTIGTGYPMVTLTTPNGGQNWNVGSSQSISWTSASVTNVKLEYSSNNGSTWNTIIGSTAASTGSYSWTIPSAASCSTLVKISDASNASYYDVSNSTFCIVTPSITVSTPNGGEVWTPGTYHYIYWSNTGASSYVSLDYSTNNGTTWTSISSYTYNYGYYNWYIPSVNSSNCLVRVTDYSNSTLKDVSNAVFTIGSTTPSITVNAPNGGQSWSVGASQNITWTSANISNVKIEYSSNNGSTWNTIIGSTAASAGSYSWTIPSAASCSTLVKISDASNASTYDVSNSTFCIITPSMTVSNPNGGESWTGNTYQNITWTSTGASSYVKLEYSINSGSTWTTIAASATNNGTYSWYVPNTASTTCIVRVTDYSNSTLTDVSNAVFTIIAATPTVTVTTPNGGQSWNVGTSQYIYWSSTNISNVKLEYSSDNGSTWNTIIGSTAASAGSYSWTIPNAASCSTLVKISDASNASYYDISNSTFCIVTPNITVTNPNGGESWTASTYKNITWTSTGASSYVKLEYSINSGSTWTTIAASATNNGTYSWYVPNTPSTTCIVRVTDYTTSTLSDVSNAVFTIASATPTVTVTSPNGGQSFSIGTSKYITWTSANITNVKLEYSSDNGSTWNTIIGSTAASAGDYLWTIPNAPSCSTLVKISDASNATTYDVSNATFCIVTPNITVTNPNGGESWTANTYQNITWTSTGASSYVKLEYSINAGSTWTTIAASATNNGTYSWYVPNTPSATCIVKVTDYTTSTLSDVSNVVFTIVAATPTVTVTSPNGGQSWNVGTSKYITWTSANITNVKLEYSSDNGSTWNTIIGSTAASAGDYLWTIPSVTSCSYLVKISDASNASTYDISNSVFCVTSPSITVTTPNGGEVWTSGTYKYIYWTSNGASSYVNLDYSTDSGSTWTSIAMQVYNYGYYNWYVPSVASSNCLVRITDYSTSTLKDVSNAVFTIAAPVPTITLTSPNGNENWATGSSQYIYWTSTNITSVKLEYSTDNASTWNTINSSTTNTGYYSWAIPSVTSCSTLVKVSDASNASYYDVSNSTFCISNPSIVVSTPNGGEKLTPGTYQYIQWTSTAASNYVNIDYSTDSGATWTNISVAASNTGYYSWYVPSVSSANCFVRVSDYYISTLKDTSNAVFTIGTGLPTVTLTAPNGGQNWAVGTSQYISWTSTSVAKVKLEYSSDNASTWNTIIDSTTASAGSYKWTIPNKVSCSVLIKISDVSNATYYDVSNSTFCITNPSITITAPNGGEKLTPGTYQYIYWTSTASSNYVNLDYSTDSGSTWTTIATAAYNYGYYSWNVPSVSSSNCLVRVTDYYTNTLKDVSNAVFTIGTGFPTVTLTTPNGSQNWAVGSSQNIYWTSTSITNVKLEYSSDNGSTWNTIIGSTAASAKSYNWKIPNMLSCSTLVKISDASNPAYYDVSDATFCITNPTITVTTPNGGETFTSGNYQYIKWTSTATSNYVKLEYSTNNGSSWTSISSSVSNTGSYSWYVPSVNSSNCLVRVTDYADSTVKDVSNAVFTIGTGYPTLTVTAPNGGQSWAVGGSQYINWTSSNVANVKIEYSSDNGSTWNTIIGSTIASYGSYNWQIPNVLSCSVLVKISDASNPGYYDVSDATFCITNPTITVTAPNGGETFTPGTYQNIYWTSTAASNYVNVDYSTNNGSTWISIATAVSNKGSYSWYVPSVSSANCLVRVTDYYTSTLKDVSNSVFTIGTGFPTLTLFTPNGGQSWAVGSSQSISWTSTSVSDVKIEYSSDNGSTWNTIIGSTVASSGYYYWMVPNTVSCSVLVKISDASNPSYYDVSNSTFCITNPTITVTTPNGGETFTSGTYKYIYWTSTGASNYVNIDYSTDNGATWTSMVSGTYNYGYYNWYVPNVSSTNCLVRVTDYYTGTLKDVSNAVFTIGAAIPTLSLTTPNGGQSWAVGSSQYIYWTSTSITNVTLEYSADNGSTWNTIIASTAASAGNYKWTIPNMVSCSTLIKISDVANPNYYDISNSTFCITNPTITVTTPNGGETFASGTYKYIYWTSTGASSYVNIDYSTDNGATWKSIVSGTYNYGYYNWYVPTVSSTNCLVRVTDYYTATITDISNGVFTIGTGIPTLALTTPNGGQSWVAGSSQYIYWTSTSVTNVKLEYSSDNGSTWNTIISSTTASAGSYKWTIPSITSCSTLVKINDASNASYYDISNSTFCITNPTITVTTPNGGETFASGTYKYIYWTSTGASNYVNLAYSTDSGSTWKSIVGGAYNYGYYNWYVPNVSSAKCLVKVTDYYTNTLKDSSNAVFNIGTNLPSVTLTTPNGGQNWVAGSSQYIYWTSSSVSKVKLEYSSDNGSTWKTIVDSTAASTGSYAWTIPNTASCAMLVKISNTSSASYYDISNSSFCVTIPTMTVTAPNGGESFTSGTYKYIYWTSTGASNYVNLDYSTDNGSTWKSIVGGAYNYGYYNWYVPSVTSTTCLVRVTDYYTNTLTDVSNAVFNIGVNLPVVTLITPNGGQTWVAGSIQNITWTSANITNVKLEYSSNSGSTWNTIINSTTASTGSYSWTIPIAPSCSTLVKVSNAAAASYYDMSNSTFCIRDSIELGVQQALSVKDNFKFYPNPAIGYVTFAGEASTSERLVVKLNDLSGREVMRVCDEVVSGTYEKLTNVNALVPGIYFIHVTQGEHSWVQKLVITQ